MFTSVAISTIFSAPVNRRKTSTLFQRETSTFIEQQNSYFRRRITQCLEGFVSSIQGTVQWMVEQESIEADSVSHFSLSWAAAAVPRLKPQQVVGTPFELIWASNNLSHQRKPSGEIHPLRKQPSPLPTPHRAARRWGCRGGVTSALGPDRPMPRSACQSQFSLIRRPHSVRIGARALPRAPSGELPLWGGASARWRGGRGVIDVREGRPGRPRRLRAVTAICFCQLLAILSSLTLSTKRWVSDTLCMSEARRTPVGCCPCRKPCHASATLSDVRAQPKNACKQTHSASTVELRSANERALIECFYNGLHQVNILKNALQSISACQRGALKVCFWKCRFLK